MRYGSDGDRRRGRALQDAASARGEYLMWFVTITDDNPRKVVAWATKADPHGGARMSGLLVADTLDELRAMLPAGHSLVTTARP